jgi:hypothetical protein
MSNIFISDIVGTGAYAVPASDVALDDANLSLATLLSGILNFTFERVIAWVKDGANPTGGEGDRTLNCLIAGAVYKTADCPSELDADEAFSFIRGVLIGVHGDGTITSVGIQEYNMVVYGLLED